MIYLEDLYITLTIYRLMIIMIKGGNWNNTRITLLSAYVRGIVDEICHCGHMKSDHEGIDGHGKCGDPACGCNKYTWRAFITKGGLLEG